MLQFRIGMSHNVNTNYRFALFFYLNLIITEIYVSNCAITFRNFNFKLFKDDFEIVLVKALLLQNNTTVVIVKV